MPYLFNTLNAETADELRFYNFISNQYPAGVPTSLLPNIPLTPTLPATPGDWSQSRMTDWLINYAFDPLYIHDHISTTNYFYFPAVPGSPTANETITGQCTNTSYRFMSYRNRQEGPIISNSHEIRLNSHVNNPISDISLGLSYGINDNGRTSLNLFNFAIKSNTTYVECGIKTNDEGGGLLDDMDRCVIAIQGWLHDGIYSSPPQNEAFRFNNTFMMSVRWDSSFTSNYSDFSGFSPRQIELNYARSLTRRHRDISCSSGTYTPGLFLTDLILYEDNFSLKYRPVGKVDNRVVCLGRGNFVPGRIYRITDPFGRVGTEDWLCASYFVPSTYSFSAWAPGDDPSYISAWGINEEDRIMIRVYTEGD